MNFFVNVIIIAMLTLLVFTLPVTAQTNFMGAYVMNQNEHIKGPEYSNALPTSITITQAKDSLIIELGSMDADNKERKNRAAFAQDGKPYSSVGATSGRKITRSMKWSDDKTSFTTTSDIYKENADSIELTRIDEYKLSPDGKELIFHRRSAETISESWEVKGTYSRS